MSRARDAAPTLDRRRFAMILVLAPDRNCAQLYRARADPASIISDNDRMSTASSSPIYRLCRRPAVRNRRRSADCALVQGEIAGRVARPRRGHRRRTRTRARRPRSFRPSPSSCSSRRSPAGARAASPSSAAGEASAAMNSLRKLAAAAGLAARQRHVSRAAFVRPRRRQRRRPCTGGRGRSDPGGVLRRHIQDR